MDAEEAIAREAMRETMARYNQAGDRGRIDEVVQCFTPDGVLAVAGEPPVEGREAIAAFMRGVVDISRKAVDEGKRRRGLMRHHVSSVLVERTGPASGAARSYFLVLTEDGLDHWGTYRDRFERIGEQWLLAERSVRVDAAVRRTRYSKGMPEETAG